MNTDQRITNNESPTTSHALPGGLHELTGRIRQCLDPLRPKKVILFGSYAGGTPRRDSDIDLIVVLNTDAVCRTYQDRMNNRLLVRRALDTLNRDHALDVLVYTMPEWREFQELDSAFSREVTSRGIDL